jgi:transcriptional regulator with XRE-family HTH domain
MSVNQRFREARKALKLSQKDFAKALCLSNTYIADIENDHRRVNDRIIKLVSMVFGINENWLKTGEGEVFYKSPDEKITRLVNIFNELPGDFQDFALMHVERLLDLRKKTKQEN